MSNTTTRKPRSRQIVPSAARRQELYRMLDHRADEGDVTAAGWLLLLSDPARRKVTP